MYDCHGHGGNQMFAIAKNQMIATQNPEQCIGVSDDHDAVLTVKCANQESQWWKYDNEVLSTSVQKKTDCLNICFLYFVEKVADTRCQWILYASE